MGRKALKRVIAALLCTAWVNAVFAEDLVYKAEDAYTAYQTALAETDGDVDAAWNRLSLFHRGKIWGECRRVYGNDGQPIDGALTVGPQPIIRYGEDGEQLPVIVYIEGDVGGVRNGQWYFDNPKFGEVRAMNADGSYDPERNYQAMTTCANTLKHLEVDGLPVILMARVGTYGSTGHHPAAYHSQVEVQRATDVLDALRERGVEQFIVVGTSAGASIGVLAAHGRDDVELLVSAAGDLGFRGWRIPATDVASEGLPQTVVLHSRDDAWVPYSSTVAFVERAQAAGVNITFTTYEGTHGMAIYELVKTLADTMRVSRNPTETSQ